MGLLRSYVSGEWHTPSGQGIPMHDAVTGDVVALLSSAGLDMQAALDYGRRVGGPALRELTFHQRAGLLEALASYLRERREELYTLSAKTGATRGDARLDIDGGIGVLFSYVSRARRELPDDNVYVEGPVETLGKTGTFLGQHIATPRRGVAIQINAFNFPVWGLLEKLTPAFVAGMPSLVKPASQTAYLAHRLVELIVESGLLPDGSLQLLLGSAGDLLDHTTGQDVVSFTGSAATAQRVRAHPVIVRNAVHFNAEADSLNLSILGPDAVPGTTEFDLYIDQLVTEMTVKAGQKCTAIRRAFVPVERMDDVVQAARERLAEITIGNPTSTGVDMGPLVSLEQREEVRRSLKSLMDNGTVVFGDVDHVEVVDADQERGAFLSPVLLRSDEPERSASHEVEAFGPVSTLLPYSSTEQVIELAAWGQGSLAGSVVTTDTDFAREVVLGTAPWHGRLLVLNAENAGETTGHGSPLPSLVHGGPGRAGGGQELGGIRGVLHYLQRSAVQADPQTLSVITGNWMSGAARQGHVPGESGLTTRG